MKNRYQIVGILSLLSLAVVAGFLFSGWGKAAAGEETVEQILWGPYWTVEPGFTSTLEMKNNRAEETLTVNVSLYFANGEEYYLDPMQLGPRQTTVINLNQVYESLPASIRARAGREGTAEVKFGASNESALMGSISVTNPERGIAWNFRLYPTFPERPLVPVRGLFWFYDPQTDGFVAVQNASEEFITVNPLFHIGGENHSVPPVQLAPGQGFKLELRKELGRLGLEQVTAGGIEFTYEGPSDAVKAHGALFNSQGFSAELDFHLREARGEERPITLRTPRFAIGPADPALGLPTPTRFEPVLALHNFAESELPLTVAVGYRTEDGAEELQIPLTISAGDTEVLSLHPYLEGVVPKEAHWASLELGYSSRENQLAAELVSTSGEGEHSIRSVLNWVRASNNEGWYWRADADYNTLIAVYNRDTEEATVAVSLDYYVEGGRQSYELPERAIPGRATEMFDIGQLIATGVPDADGDVIPSTVSFGGYRVRKLAPDQDLTLTTEALLFDRRRKTYLSFYNTGCCYDALRLRPSSLTGPVGSQAQVVLEIRNTCFGWEPAEFPTYWSENAGVATINGLGLVSCVGGGTTKVWGQAFYPEYAFWECFYLSRKDSSPVTVESVTVNLSPVTVAPAASTMVTVTVLPAQAGRSVSLQVQEVANSGGHIHLGRTLGSFANPSGTTDANGEFTTPAIRPLSSAAPKRLSLPPGAPPATLPSPSEFQICYCWGLEPTMP